MTAGRAGSSAPLRITWGSVLTQAVYSEQGRVLLKVGDTAVDYNEAFRLYISTKLPNPHYLPDVCIKVTGRICC